MQGRDVPALANWAFLWEFDAAPVPKGKEDFGVEIALSEKENKLER